MPENESVELTDEQLGQLVRRLLGPPEEWDDDAADAARYVKELLENIVREKQEKGEPISQRLHDWLDVFESTINSSRP